MQTPISVYRNSTHKSQYISKNSNHPKNVKKGIICTLEICPSETNLDIKFRTYSVNFKVMITVANV